ncbi:sigma-70 family RNA polymerase sigma factor [Phytohabitans sp. ZYX-F-186]|uniref:Sigma-70 family RNA polymerase sigma factor n=1 Tax=Phytohabitans maris TaxID=3071409 RepID=A0ABU0ZBS4_9ACTN|nr:sigma-70 family RNA polymerase sigma factor [Phytohabitans sp. ZYX-F-186]MDQ7904497.1 sigma-70 family RNA polymerase sigma factor [Phytohabitans sp. ZYX-F-186]
MGTEGVRDEAWHDDLYRRYRQRVMGVAASLLGYQHSHDAEEIAQETFTTAWVRREAVGDDPWPWLYVTTRNHVYNRQRLHVRLLRALARLGEPGPPHDGGLRAWERRHDFAPAWQAISQDDRELLRQRYLHEMSDEQIAQVLGILPATARKRVQRARDRLRKVIEEMDSDPTPGGATPPAWVGPLAHAGARKGK